MKELIASISLGPMCCLKLSSKNGMIFRQTWPIALYSTSFNSLFISISTTRICKIYSHFLFIPTICAFGAQYFHGKTFVCVAISDLRRIVCRTIIVYFSRLLESFIFFVVVVVVQRHHRWIVSTLTKRCSIPTETTYER